MKLRNLKYFLSESVRSMIKNRLMSLASIITVASCVLILSVSYFVVTNVNKILEGIERSPFIVVFIDDSATEDDVTTLESELLAIPYIHGLSFTSAEEAFENFTADLENVGIEERFLEGMDSYLLPRSFSLELTQMEYQHLVVNAIQDLTHVYHILHDQTGIDFFIDLSRGVSLLSIVIILFLGTISTVIIINTIKITVSARQNEINIMKYVGATDWFIRWPFLMEGILIGVFGASIALILGYFIYTNVVYALLGGDSVFNLANLFFFEDPRSVLEVFMFLTPICILLGIVIGVVGSATSIRRYLRV